MSDASAVEALFFAALDKTDAERAAYLDSACGDDTGLRRQVEKLLKAHPRVGDFLKKPIGEQWAVTPQQPGATPEFDATSDDQGGGLAARRDLPIPAVPGYDILEVLGHGGMGVVYKARHLALNRTVALKMMLTGVRPELADPVRFRTEAEAVARLQHPNIVQIHEVGEANGHPYCALEFVEGGSLAGKLASKPMPAREAAKLVEALARAMQLAHSRNVVHRDLKPTNVLLTADGTPKISDFGLARQLDSDSGHTQTGVVLGTPSYMAPEQASGRAHEAGPAADVYALGAILYDCLAGRPPFKGSTVVETLEQVRTQEPAPPSRWHAGVARDLETICLKCLRKEPEQRYASAAELADDLARYQRGEPIQARPLGRRERAVKWVKRNPLVTGAAVLALVVGTTVSYLKYREAEAARIDEAQRVTERDDALEKASERAKERDAALDDARRQLSNSSFLLAVAAYDSRDVALARHRLASIDPDYRGWEWHYFRRLSTGGIFTLYGHTSEGNSAQLNSISTQVITGEVTGVAFSPDGTRLVTGSFDKTAIVWDARTGTRLLQLKGHSREVQCVAFSPDGTRIATGSWDNTAKLWDARSGALLLDLKRHTGMLWGVAFSPDGTRLVTGSPDQMAKVWDAQTGKPLLEVKDPAQVYGVAFSPDGTRFATAGTNRIKVWDARTGALQRELPGHAGTTFCVAFSPDGTRLVTGGYDQTAKVWDLRTGSETFTLKGHTGTVRSAAFSPDGTRVVTGSEDATARVWDARAGNLLLELKGHTAEVTSAAFSPDGTRVVTGSGDRTAKVWDARTGTPQPELKGHISWVNSAAFSPDGTRVVTGSWDRTARVRDARTGAPLLELKGHTGQVYSVAFSPDGTRIATGGNDQAKVWDAATGTAQFDLTGQKRGVHSVAFSPDGTRIVTGGGDGSVKVWDAETGAPLLDLKGHTGRVRGVAFSPDARRIATASWDETAKVWDARTGALLLDLKGHMTYVASVAFSPDGRRIATASLDQTAKVWDAETGKPLLNLPGHTMYVMSVAFSPDGKRLVTGSTDKTAKLWDARTGMPLLDLTGHAGELSSVAFSPDGTRIVTASADGTAKVWDARSGTQPLDLMGHTSPVTGVAFSPDGTRIVTGSGDLTAKVWDARTRTTLLELASHTKGVLSVAFSPDGTRIVTGSHDKTARVWDARSGAPLLDLKGHTGEVWSVAFSLDGTRIVTGAGEWNKPAETKVWDAQSGAELKGEPIPATVANNWTSPDGRFFAHPEGNRVELIPLQPDEEELAYRRLHTEPDLGRYREGYEAARAGKDDFAARFYLNLLADGKLAAGRTQDALDRLAALSAANPRDTELCLTVAALQAWFGREKDLATTRRRILALAEGTNNDARLAGCAARVCNLRPSSDKAELEAARAHGDLAVRIRPGEMGSLLALGLAEYRSNHDADAEKALLAAERADPNDLYAAGVSACYRAMILFRQGNSGEARQLAITAAAKMKPLPRDENNPLAGTGTLDDLILWLAYKEAKAMIQFGATPPPKAENDKK
jgi:WD40 repeat protein/tRNA A-37 threonylcarbamoyl transferase component Bud32